MSRVFCGNLPMDIREDDLADLFMRYGRILGIDVKTPRNPPAYAFIDYDDPRSAEDAVHDRDGYELAGERLRVEISRSGGRGRDGGGRGGGRGGRGGPPSENSVIVTGLPKSASWQDLKDHFRKVGHVTFTDVDRMGGGIVEFSSRADADEAWRQMDGAEFSNPFDTVRISVSLPNTSYLGGGGGGGRDYDRRDDYRRDDYRDDRRRDDYDRRDYDRRDDRGRDDYDRRDDRGRDRSRDRDDRRRSRSRSRDRRDDDFDDRRRRDDDREPEDRPAEDKPADAPVANGDAPVANGDAPVANGDDKPADPVADKVADAGEPAAEAPPAEAPKEQEQA